VAPRWRSLDGRVAEVVEGSVVARGAGTTTLLAEWEGALTAVEVRVRRVLRLRVTDIDGVPVRAAIVVHAAARTDSLTASAAGRVHLREQLPEAGSIAVDVRGADGDATRPARLTLDVGTMGADAGVVLLPSRWRVAGGRHDGIEVPVDPRDATRDRAGSFVRLADDPRVGERVVGWSRTRLPIRVAAGAGITDGDTARFWATARDVERDLGMRLFAAAPAGDTSAGLRIRVAGGVRGAAVTQLSWTGGGEVMDAELLLRASSVLHDRRVVAHELVHVLGFGHTDAWPTIVAPAGTTGASWLTPTDVAWIQLAYRLRATQERLGAAHGLDAALAAPDR
jgi:hypothetical protein